MDRFMQQMRRTLIQQLSMLEMRSMLSGERLRVLREVTYLTSLLSFAERQRDLIGAIEAWDSGKTKEQNAVYDIDECINCFKYFAGWADKIQGKVIQNDPKKLAYTVHEPFGVCAQIIPWNYPLAMAAWKLAPALAAGNVVVLKSSEVTPLSILYLAKIFRDVGFPPGVVNILSGYGATCGKALASRLRC